MHAGKQSWRDLLFVHFEVPVDVVRALVPAQLELDLWHGRAYVGLVPFAMRDIVPAGVPRALGLNFLETNLRTYVHVGGRAPGVYFFSLDASSRIAVRVARLGFGLPYFDASMRCAREAEEFRYESVRRGADAQLRAHSRVGRSIGNAVPGTVEHFLLERYLLYAIQGGRVRVGQVHHAPYPAHEADLIDFEETLTRAAGLVHRADRPAFVHASPGVDVEVFSMRDVPWNA
jgi:uncharacterized protein YqjF (DUF2071 family)